jgi:hypothetical protein
MPNDDRIRIIYSRAPESAAMLANVKRPMAIAATLIRLTFNDADEIRALFSELIGKKVDESFLLMIPGTAAYPQNKGGRLVECWTEDWQCCRYSSTLTP